MRRSDRTWRGPRLRDVVDRRGHVVRQRAGRLEEEAPADQAPDSGDVEVRGRHEQRPRLPDPAQVADGEENHRPDRELDLVGEEDGVDRGEGRDAGRDGDGDGDDIADHERRSSHDARRRTEVVARHDIARGALGVGLDRLPVRGDDDREHEDDENRERQRPGDGRHAGGGEHAHHLLRPVGRRADVVAAEDRERLRLREPLMSLVIGADGTTDERRPDLAQERCPP